MALRIWLPLLGNVNQQGASEVTATVSGATVNTAGKIGSCYSFDGSDDFISLSGATLYNIFKGGSQQFSVCFWVYHNDATRAIIFGDYGLSGAIGFNIELSTAHGVRFYWNGSPDKNFNSTSYVAAQGWTHIAITYNGSVLNIYKDGILSSDSYNGTLAEKSKTSGLYYLGRDSRTGTTALNGRLNDFRIYDECLSATAVREIAQGLVLHYKLDDLENGVLDSSGYGHNGTITGTITTENDSPRYSTSSYFNGSSYILTPAGSFAWNDLTQLTFSVWMKPTASMTGWRGSVGIAADSNQTARGIAITDYENEFRGTYTNGSSYVTVATGKTLTQNEWHHCAGTLNETEFKLYFDGVLVKTQTIDWGTATLNANARFEVGVDVPGGDEKFTGNYSDVRCYCTVLDATNILQLYHTSAKVDNLGGFHTFELSETNNGLELLAVPLTTSYGNHTNIYTGYDSNGEITMTGGSSIGSYYIPINPSGKTYYYDIEVSTDSGNGFYIGFQRYDANKTARSNDATVYLPGLSGSSEARTHKHYHGTVDLSTDSVNPCAFTSLRILNDWSGANGRKATIHKISLREVSTLQNTKINKYGQAITTELIEMNDKFRVQKNGIIETNEIIEL